MNRDEVDALRALLAPTGWPDRARTFARALRVSTTHRGGLLLVGTPAEEPWHLAAHLDDEARFSGLDELAPTLVRWDPQADAPNTCGSAWSGWRPRGGARRCSW